LQDTQNKQLNTEDTGRVTHRENNTSSFEKCIFRSGQPARDDDRKCFKFCYSPGNQHGGRLKTKLYEKRDVFTFPKIDFTFISSTRLWGENSHRYSRVCFKNRFSEQSSTADATLLKQCLGLSHRYKH
jgi:hypothetical protein